MKNSNKYSKLKVDCFKIENLQVCTDKVTLTASITNIEEQLLQRLEREGNLYVNQFKKNCVEAVYLHDCPNLTKIPQNLCDLFSNLTTLHIKNCGLKEIRRNGLKAYKALQYVNFWNMSIQFIASDLFADFEDIRGIMFYNTEIKFIGKDAFKHLKKLEYVDLRRNPTIDLVYARKNGTSFLTDFLVKENTTQITKLSELHAVLVGIYHDDEFKDLTIKIGKNEFKVHKLMLSARSTTLAEILKNNPDEITLDDIDVDIFKVVLGYIYNDTLPQKYDSDSLKVFEAAKKYKLETLEQEVFKFIWDQIDFETAVNLHAIGIKSNDEELKKKAFKEIQKIFSNVNLKDDLMDDPEKLRQLLSKKRAHEDKIKNAENEMKRVREDYENFMKEPDFFQIL